MKKSKDKTTELMNELEKIAPELSKIKKENPFKVPENYFESFSARLQTRLEAEKNAIPKKQTRIIQFLKPAIGLAAGFALIFMLAYWPLNNFTQNQQATIGNDDTDILDMIYASLVEEIDENSFYALLDDPNGTVQFSDDDLAHFVNTNSSEYEIYSETNN
jgi:hypothetical protein